MPSTPAQLRAAKKWRENHKEIFRERCDDWLDNNYDKHLGYARKCMAKKYLLKCALRDLMRCLL
jgi:hypothetical protein